MSKKLILLAVAAVSAVLFALPAVASAETWHITKAEKFTAHGGHALLTVDMPEATEITCQSNTATGEYENTTTGKNLVLTFHQCEVAGTGGFIPCNTPGLPSGTIRTTALTFHNIMVEKEKPAILITPNNGHFATFNCPFIHINVRGNGIIGEVEKKCGESSKEAGLSFTSVDTGTQTWRQITTAGTVFDLTSSKNGEPPFTASEDATGMVTFGSSQTITCTA